MKLRGLFDRLNPEEKVPDLVNQRLVAAGFAAGEALEAGKHKIRSVFEMEQGLRSVEILGRVRYKRAIFDGYKPLAAPLAVYFYPEYPVHAFSRFLVNRSAQQDKHIRGQHP